MRKDREKLLPWGNFDPVTVKNLQEQGVYVYLCCSLKKDFTALAEQARKDKTFVLEQISCDKTFCYYAVISREELSGAGLNPVSLPARSLDQVNRDLADHEARQEEIRQELKNFALSLPELQEYCSFCDEKLEFAAAQSSMTRSGEIACLKGYIPAPDLEVFRAAAHDAGWGFLAEDPAEDDRVPTLIRKPKFLNIMDPLFDFIGISPGYRENDVNVFFLLFFPLFFGIIVGDAGYGLLFILAALTGKILCRKKPAAKLPLNLFLLLSIYTLIWGWLNGSWFGIPNAQLPSFMRGWGFLTDPANSPLAEKFAGAVKYINSDMSAEEIDHILSSSFKDKFIQFFCFVIAGIHLVSARVFKFTDDIRVNWRAIGHIGWALTLAANAMVAINLVVFPGTFPAWGIWLYIAGILLIAITIHGADALNLPFSLVGSFTDVLSYIRLFAVGLAGAYISEKFNVMGAMLAESFPEQLKVLGMICLLLVAVFGNVLNIGLGFLSVMVHAIRLNTLEFSNHVEMQWGGFRFTPFTSKKNKSK